MPEIRVLPSVNGVVFWVTKTEIIRDGVARMTGDVWQDSHVLESGVWFEYPTEGIVLLRLCDNRGSVMGNWFLAEQVVEGDLTGRALLNNLSVGKNEVQLNQGEKYDFGP